MPEPFVVGDDQRLDVGLIDSGNRKSSTVKAMTRPLFDIQHELQKQQRPVINAAKARKKTLEDVAKAAANALRKNPENQDLILRAEQANIAATTFTVPELPLLIVSDATPEALGLRLAEQDERLAVFDAERVAASGRARRGVASVSASAIRSAMGVMG